MTVRCARSLPLLPLLCLVACSRVPLANEPAAPELAAPGGFGPTHPVVAWEEHFSGNKLDWGSPSRHSADVIAKVFAVRAQDSLWFLHAHHDARRGQSTRPPPAVHYGKAFRSAAQPLDAIASLAWRWRVNQHPNAGQDPWLDVAASVYVIVRTPGLVFDGRGFKFGWLASQGTTGDQQRGIVQIPLRTGGPIGVWQQEQVDVCQLYRKWYGPCEGEKLVYIGVVTDADNTSSVADADYADFVLSIAAPPGVHP